MEQMTQSQVKPKPPLENPLNSTFLQGVLEGIKSDSVSNRTKDILRELQAISDDGTVQQDIRLIDNAVARHTYPDISYNRLTIYDKWPAVNSGFTGSVRELYLLICASLKGTYYLELDYNDLADHTGIGVSTIQKSARNLKNMGLIATYLPPVTKKSEPEVVMICPWMVGTGRPSAQNKAMFEYINLLDANGYFHGLIDYHKSNDLDAPEYDDKVNYLLYRLGSPDYSRSTTTVVKTVSLNRKTKAPGGVGMVIHDAIKNCLVTAVAPVRDPLLQPSTRMDDAHIPDPPNPCNNHYSTTKTTNITSIKSKRQKKPSPPKQNGRLAQEIVAKMKERDKNLHAKQHEDNIAKPEIPQINTDVNDPLEYGSSSI